MNSSKKDHILKAVADCYWGGTLIVVLATFVLGIAFWIHKSGYSPKEQQGISAVKQDTSELECVSPEK